MWRTITLFWLLLLQLVGLSLFLKGFFPLKQAIPGSASFLDLPPEPGSTETGYRSPAVFDRLALVLIDALRADFVFNNTKMEYIRTLIDNNNTLSFIARAHSPTVTMPRIKALMTGGIPGFVDVVFNSVSTALQEDSLLTQSVSVGRKIVFFGDDTWMKLFPGHFLRSEGTTSFFVTDYSEVDNNVTKHLDKELKSTDWDMMVLHYLGLDHIGHLAGPNSPLVGPKLQEMDFIIEKIHRSLLKDDSERGMNSLLMLCGDHGMSDSGSHGGATPPETLTPLVFLGSRFQNGKGSAFSGQIVDQIDVVSTLATVLGLPIPQNSVGFLIPQVLAFHSPRDKLRSLQINAHQLTKVLKANGHKTNTIWEQDEAYHLHRRWLEATKSENQDVKTMKIQADQVVKQYMKALNTMSSQITASLSCYDLYSMVCGIVVLLQVFAWLAYKELYHSNTPRKTSVFIQSVMPSVSSFFAMGACFLVLVAVHLSVCSSTLVSGTCSSETLCSKQPSAIFFSAIFVFFSSVSISAVITNIDTTPSLFRHVIQEIKPMLSSPLQSLLVLGTIFHVFSLLSSSFVEEEHQTWYFLVKTYFIVYFCTSVKGYFKERSQGPQSCNHEKLHNCISEELLKDHQIPNKLQIRSQLNEELNEKHCIPHHEKTEKETWFSLVIPLVCLAFVRILRTWNQTGIKWADQPDIGDWLVLPHNKLVLSLVSASSLFVILICTFKRSDVITTILQALGLLFVYHYRAATGVVWSPLTTSQPITQGLTEAGMAYACSFVLLFVSLVKFRRAYKYESSTDSPDGFVIYRSIVEGSVQSFTAGIVVLAALVLRVHNVFLLAVFIVQEWCFSTCLSKTKAISWTTYLIYFWFGQVAYFSLGNSNSLSTIDIAAGYIGMQAHDSAVVFILLAFTTYCGPLLWLTALVRFVVKNSSSREQLRDSLYNLCVTYTLPQSLLLCVYTILVYGQRYHLFVWSVFSPKLLYDTMRTLVMLVSSTLVLVFSAVIGRTTDLYKSD